ncbi:MAG TPA: peroxidase family protein [Steroidobacteraceae bacterium]|nr:peroxidase family protein [Steroidobacteraceae bacterium]
MSLLDLVRRIASTFPAKEILAVPVVEHQISRLAIEYLASRTPPRPRPLSLWSPLPMPPGPGQTLPITDYTSWPGLTDRTFSSRHLPPAELAYTASLPANGSCDPQAGPPGPITSLFQRESGRMIPDRSSVLFMFFAQWFTDSFLRFNANDRRRNSSNHEIDLCQIYGLTESTATLLRSQTGGKLASQIINGEEYPEYLYLRQPDGTLKVKEKFQGLPYISSGLLDLILAQQSNVDDARKAKLFATGLERGNSSIGYVAISTLFLREHNRLCDALAGLQPHWNDERLFQTARLINIALVLRIVIEDYINHIAGQRVFVFDNSFAESQNWYRTNWMAVEFDMLYRWHGLVPETVNIKNQVYKPGDFQTNNDLLESVGLAALIEGASNETAGKIGLFNTPRFLIWAECQNITMGRSFRLRSFNEYRKQFSLAPLTDWDQLTSDVQVQTTLKGLYKDINKLEFVVGLFAEEAKSGGLFGELMTTMVAVDAFTQALTNPVLSTHVFNSATLTTYGLEQIAATASLQDLVNRNVEGAAKAVFGV